ncbi:MAG: hypothetical protein RL220_2104 [Bacteroidota bacterium]
MKHLTSVAIALIISVAVAAQPDVTSAYNANKQGNYDVAVEYIEKALADPKATAKEKTWRYRGDIYLNISKSENHASKYPNSVALSKESYFKSMDLDTHGDYKVEVQQSLGELQMIALQRASAHYEAKDFCSSADQFVIANEISTRFAIVDSAAIFNAAFCFDKCGKKDKALEGYKRCGEIGYNVPDVFSYSVEILNEQGKPEEAKKVLSDARARYPKDASLLRQEVNVYLNDNKYAEAEALLKALTESDPSNETVWFVLGVTYQKLAKKTEEEAAYKKAIEIRPNYYDALFNLGAFYFNEGFDIEKTCADIPRSERQKFDDCLAKSMVYFTQSVDYLEKAYNIQNTEIDIMNALKDAYYKAERMEDYARMKALIDKK